MYQHLKCYKTGTDRLSDLNLGMGVVINVDRDWRGVRRPPVAVHLQLPHFLLYSVLFKTGSAYLMIEHTTSVFL